MEELILGKLVSMVFSNESPSNIILCCVVIYILVMLKGFRKDLQKLTLDVHLIKNNLGKIDNVIELPSNKKSESKRD